MYSTIQRMYSVAVKRGIPVIEVTRQFVMGPP